jgi:hypothetical protein
MRLIAAAFLALGAQLAPTVQIQVPTVKGESVCQFAAQWMPCTGPFIGAAARRKEAEAALSRAGIPYRIVSRITYGIYLYEIEVHATDLGRARQLIVCLSHAKDLESGTRR